MILSYKSVYRNTTLPLTATAYKQVSTTLGFQNCLVTWLSPLQVYFQHTGLI